MKEEKIMKEGKIERKKKFKNYLRKKIEIKRTETKFKSVKI
jgi:hypothetical protein